MGAGAEAQAQELAQQSMDAPAAAEVIDQSAGSDLVVQSIEETQQRIARRDAPVDALEVRAGAQVGVEQR